MPRVGRAVLRARVRAAAAAVRRVAVVAAAAAAAAAPAPAAAPACVPRAPRVASAERPRPCLGCLKSALADKQGAGPLCQDVAGVALGARCLRCSSGHFCVPM